MGGKPCIRGQRVTVAMVLGLLAAGRSRFSRLTRISKPGTSTNAWLMLRGEWKNVTRPWRPYENLDFNRYESDESKSRVRVLPICPAHLRRTIEFTIYPRDRWEPGSQHPSGLLSGYHQSDRLAGFQRSPRSALLWYGFSENLHAGVSGCACL